MGTVRIDGKEPLSGPHHQDVILADMAEKFAVGEFAFGYALRQVGTCRLRFFFSHIFLLSISSKLNTRKKPFVPPVGRHNCRSVSQSVRIIQSRKALKASGFDKKKMTITRGMTIKRTSRAIFKDLGMAGIASKECLT
jgi:hypothetical protein